MRFGFCVDQHRMTLVESTPLRVLAGQPDGCSGFEQGSVRKQFCEAVIDRPFPGTHFRTLFEQLGHFGVHVKAARGTRECGRQRTHLRNI